MKHNVEGDVQAAGTRRMRRILFLAAAIILLLSGCNDGGPALGSVSGFVKDGDEPVPGATVTFQGTNYATLTDATGAFTLHGIPAGPGARFSAWKEGYYCGLLIDVNVPTSGVVVNIRRHQLVDYENYEPLPPEGPTGCVQCHPALTEMSLKDAHLGAAQNPRFLSTYYGQDVLGNQSPDTQYRTITTQWGTFEVPEPYDRTKPYYGPGWRIDFPGSVGTCTSCHIPGAAVNGDVEPRSAAGVERYGVHCDFCHKIGYVHLDSNTGLPPVSRPGIQNIDLLRPDPTSPLWSELFMGSLPDGNSLAEGAPSPYGGLNVTTFEAKRLLYSESRYCAPCHYGGFWGQAVYTSYQEWVESPYADPQSPRYRTCQNCHMPSPTLYKGKALTNIAPGKGGLERDPASLHSHNMTVTPELLRNSMTMDVSTTLNNGELAIAVTLTNDRTGHHVPTDSPLRHLILLVEARDRTGKMLTLKEGSLLPSWCGVGDSQEGYYANLPGKAYAKILKEMWTNVEPAFSYWRHTTVASDNRLAALASDKSTYVFSSPGSAFDVTVTLLYRRAFIELMKQKGWDCPDIVIAKKTIGF